jgi:hypothetical protein
MIYDEFHQALCSRLKLLSALHNIFAKLAKWRRDRWLEP